jgi:predicted nuclease of restriction endonuclease-like RecB superfamily
VLTADLVRARRRGDKLQLLALGDDARSRALAPAKRYLEVTRANVGQARGTIEAAYKAVKAQVRDRKVANGLLKLIADRCEYETASEIDPKTIRQALFLAAHQARLTGSFDRDTVVERIAKTLELTPEQLDKAMFSDLKSAHRLIRFDDLSAGELLQSYELSSRQAVLLRATRVDVKLRCKSSYTLRYLFRQLRFRQLLFTLDAKADGWHQLTIDGPFSLFRQSTRYGLQLALVLPAIEACDEYELRADLRWGQERKALTLELCSNDKGQAARAARVTGAKPDLAPEIEQLLARFEKRKSDWSVKVGDRVLNLPGVGVCVPDLVFLRKGHPPIYLELLGYWSRETVWRRIELVEKGLTERIIFAVPSRLRVSEEALDDDLPAAIYAFKGALIAKEIEKRLEALSN